MSKRKTKSKVEKERVVEPEKEAEEPMEEVEQPQEEPQEEEEHEEHEDAPEAAEEEGDAEEGDGVDFATASSEEAEQSGDAEEKDKGKKKKRRRGVYVGAGVATTDMILDALQDATSFRGMTVVAIREHVIRQHDVNPSMLRNLLRNAFTKLLAKELIVRPKGVEAPKSVLLGRYRLAAKPKGEDASARAPPVRKLRNNTLGVKKKSKKRRRW